MTFKIMLADDNRNYLATISPLIRSLQGVELVGQAHDGIEALTMATALLPDLVLLDIAMPRLNGLEVAGRMQGWPHKPRIVFLSMHQQDSYRVAARELDAEGYFNKSDFVSEVLPFIERIVQQTPQ